MRVSAEAADCFMTMAGSDAMPFNQVCPFTNSLKEDYKHIKSAWRFFTVL